MFCNLETKQKHQLQPVKTSSVCIKEKTRAFSLSDEMLCESSVRIKRNDVYLLKLAVT